MARRLAESYNNGITQKRDWIHLLAMVCFHPSHLVEYKIPGFTKTMSSVIKLWFHYAGFSSENEASEFEENVFLWITVQGFPFLNLTVAARNIFKLLILTCYGLVFVCLRWSERRARFSTWSAPCLWMLLLLSLMCFWEHSYALFTHLVSWRLLVLFVNLFSTRIKAWLYFSVHLL